MAVKNEKFEIGSRRDSRLRECTTNVNSGLMYFWSPQWVVELRGAVVEEIRSILSRGNTSRGKIASPKRERVKVTEETKKKLTSYRSLS